MSATIARPLGICNPGNDPAIYVACLASYNRGVLHGAWINLGIAATAEDIQECIDYILKLSLEPGAEEYAVHDSQLLPGCLSSTEWPDLGKLEEYAQTVCELSENGFAAYRIACDNEGEILSLDQFRETYCGTYDRPEDYAEELAEECGELDKLPDFLRYRIDWEGVWHDLSCDGYSATFVDGEGYAVFRPA